MPAPKKYDAETQERAVRMYRDRLAERGGSKVAEADSSERRNTRR